MIQTDGPGSESELAMLLEAIYLHFHYDFRRYSKASLRRRLRQAVGKFHCSSISQLQQRLLQDEKLFPALLQFLTVQVSDLFRDPLFFRSLREQVVPLLRTYPSLKLWVAGCSTGEEAYSLAILLREEGLLPTFPATTKAAVIVVVHLPLSRPSLLPVLFAPKCAPPVREPHDKEPVAAGTIWFAPPDYHLLIESDRTFSFCLSSPVHHSRPAIDVLFKSEAQVYGAALIAMVLTGASRDGASSATAVRQVGGLVAGQDALESEFPWMPTAAIAEADPHCIGSLSDLARFVGAMIKEGSL